MSGGRTLRTSFALLLLGAGVAALWIYASGGKNLLETLGRVSPLRLPVLVALTLSCLGLRFVRWQYLLRRAGVRLPERESLVIYLASLIGIATPAYVGELLRSVLVRRRFGVPIAKSAYVILNERLADVCALAVLGLVLADRALPRAAMAGLLLLVPLIAYAFDRLASRFGVHPSTISALRARGATGIGLVLSVLAWLPPLFLVSQAGASLGIPLSLREGARIFSTTTLLGGMTLMPAGVGSTGSLAIYELGRIGLGLEDSVAVVSLVRLSTAGLALAVSALFLALASRAGPPSTTHFADIAAEYGNQFAPHVWDRLLARKTSALAGALGAEKGLGLDVGCGLGAQARAMRDRGFRVISLDPAADLLRAGQAGPPQVAASATALPFADESLGFAYAIGSLHHLAGPAEQSRALAELRRVLKKDATLIVHETNPRNPLFRFYMGYVFPILKSIDEGTEWWIEPESLDGASGFSLREVQYSTFLPDFAPAFMMKFLSRIEEQLEQSRLRRYSVHYMAVLQREGGSRPSEPPRPGSG
jgi:SAM-dependent methyltransferase